MRLVDRGVASWSALTKAQQREMDEVTQMWRGAADQGYAAAQYNLGVMYTNGEDVKLDIVEAVVGSGTQPSKGMPPHSFTLVLRPRMAAV